MTLPLSMRRRGGALGRACLPALLAAMLLSPGVSAGESFLAREEIPPLAQACDTPRAVARFDAPLNRVTGALIAHEPVTIVALGSSSTAGAGASTQTMSYPSRLEEELRSRFPDADITVLNRGVNGETTIDMLARLDLTVLSAKPTLVLWQLGANTVLREQSVSEIAGQMRDGIARIRASGADVVLIDPQYAPRMLDKRGLSEMLALIDGIAHETRVPVFHRYDVMRHWHRDRGLPFAHFIVPDGIHMNDWGYGCWAKLMAEAMTDSINRSRTLAVAPRVKP